MPVGTAVAEVLNQTATKRLYSRLHDMREAMIDRLEEVDRSKVDKNWFQSEEFQNMFCTRLLNKR
jgi:hypothetical protein